MTETAIQVFSPAAALINQAQFRQLAEVPPEAEWFANLTNRNTRLAYRKDVGQFVQFLGLKNHIELCTVTRAHVIAWRKDLERQQLGPATIRRKLSAVGALFDYLCARNATSINPTHGVERPTEGSNQGKTPAISDDQARALLAAPEPATLKGKRDRAVLAVLLYHGLRRAELCSLGGAAPRPTPWNSHSHRPRQTRQTPLPPRASLGAERHSRLPGRCRSRSRHHRATLPAYPTARRKTQHRPERPGCLPQHCSDLRAPARHRHGKLRPPQA